MYLKFYFFVGIYAYVGLGIVLDSVYRLISAHCAYQTLLFSKERMNEKVLDGFRLPTSNGLFVEASLQ